MLGSLSASLDHHLSPVTRFRTQKTASLFAFLALRAGTPQPREELIERFWPESDRDNGRMSLRTALAALRKDFGDALQTDKMFVNLNSKTDLQRFKLALRAARSEKLTEQERIAALREAVEVYGSPLLSGFYDDWILLERERLETEYRACLIGLVRWHTALGELPTALDFAYRAAASDPLSEEIRSDLIRLLKKMGRSDEARRQFDDLDRLLQEQLGEVPSLPVAALVAEIPKAAEARPAAEIRAVHLPVSRGRFRGRHDLLTLLAKLLSGPTADAESPRLLTLFGPGGIGKTRLAIEAARRLAAKGHIGETWFVPLATAVTAEEVWEKILETLAMKPSSTAAASVLISARLALSGKSLLVLDNLEQVSLEASEIASALLDSSPKLTILATSRRRLGAAGEYLLAVDGLEEEEAVGMFLDHARGVAPAFVPSEAEKGTIRALTTRLEGFPLAINLAAAWLSVMSPAEMLTQLEGGILNLPERAVGEQRHASITAAIQWSVDLLGPDLRRAFLTLSIFRGGWDAAAAATVCGVARDSVASLRDRSLITAQTHEGTIRFTMHEALREFGTALLSPAELKQAVGKHTEYFVALAESVGHERLVSEHANLRTAFAAAGIDQQRRFALALIPFWDKLGHWQEGRLSIASVLAALSDASARAELLHSLGRFCYKLNDFAASQIHHDQALELCRLLGDDRGMGRAYHALASISFHYQPDLARSRRLTELSLQHFVKVGDAAGQAAALIGLGVLATAEGNLTVARRFQQQSLEIAEAGGLQTEKAIAHWRLGLTALGLADYEEADRRLSQAAQLFQSLQEPVNLAYVRIQQGVLAQKCGNSEQAQRNYEDALSFFRELGELWVCAICLGNLARLSAEAGEYAQATAHWLESLRLRLIVKDEVNLTTAMDGIAGLLFRIAAVTRMQDQAHDAIRMRAATAQIRSHLGIGAPAEEDRPEQEAEVRALLGETDCALAEREGNALSQDAVVQLALLCLTNEISQSRTGV